MRLPIQKNSLKVKYKTTENLKPPPKKQHVLFLKKQFSSL